MRSATVEAMTQSASDRMEQAQIWGDLSSAPDIQEKVRVFEQMIPAGVESVIDVGCGDGAITDALARTRRVVGVDSSRAALAHVGTESVLADAANLPFEDRSFDLALSSQMLEHLDDATYAAALAELRRVARGHVLISVPYREDLGMRMIRCPHCGLRQHVWGHVRRFTAESIARDLPGFDVVDARVFGDIQDPAWPPPLLWAIHGVFNGWYGTTGQHPMCARCHATDFSGMRGFPPYSDRVKVLVDRAGRRPRMPYWIAVLGRRRDDG
jgi:SAM-dependent methyltransferase